MDDEVERCYEEFYEDVHTEFLKFGEIVNFKVSKNGSFHLRGNVYVHYKSVDSAVLAYQSINGRYFAGKQVSLEFVGVTKWKVAICGEFMKSRLKTCTRGTACNFIHCFRNPGGDYEWADWDKPPPKYWSLKMAALFGYPEEFRHDSQMEKEHRKSITSDADRYRTRRTRSRERDSSRNRHEKSDACSRHHGRGTSWSRKSVGILDENRGNFERNRKNMDTSDDSDLDRDLSRRDSRGADRHRNTTKKKTRNHVEESGIEDSHEDNGSGSDWLNRNKNHNSTRETSSHHKEEHEVRVKYVRKRTHSTSSSRNLSSKDRHRDVFSEESKKSYGHRSKDQQYHDDYGNSRKKTRESNSRDEGFDRYDSRSSKNDGERDEELSLVDAGFHAISKTDEFHIAESDSTDLESERARKRHKLSRWDPSEDTVSADLLETNRHDETKYSSPREESSKSYYSRSKCYEIMDKGGAALESGSRISRKHEKLPKECSDDGYGSSHRSISPDSESLSDRDLKKGRRSSDKRHPIKHQISRKRTSPVFDQSVGNSSTHEQSSEELCSERSTPIVRRRQGHRKSSDGSEGVASVEEYEESKEERRHRHNRKHRTHGHRDGL